MKKIESNQLLEDISLVDFTTRLPGPFASMILKDLGAKVTKIEDKQKLDAFKTSELINFNQWYKTINNGKEVKIYDLSSNFSEVTNSILQAEIILSTPFTTPKIKEILKSSKTDKNPPFMAIIELNGGHNEWRHLHDLNALGMTRTFKQHLQDSKKPPYLPFAGIGFAQYIATAALAALHKATNSRETIIQKVYLQDVIPMIFDALHTTETPQSSESTRFLHNGLFPCYQIYELQDNKHLCVAAVEEKFWKEIISIFQLQLSIEDRYDESGRTQSYMAKEFKKLTSNQVKRKIEGKSVCLNIVEN